MFGYSMVQLVRMHARKLDRPLRDNVLQLYKPLKWTPCFLHKKIENRIKRVKKFSVIVEFKGDCFEHGLKRTRLLVKGNYRCKVRQSFSLISCCSVTVTPNMLADLLNHCKEIRKIYLNRDVEALLDVAVPSANAKRVVRNNTELTGKGVTVAVVDTGVHPHSDLEGRITTFKDFVNDKANPYDDNGHGTHCAGDAAGNGAASDGKYAGSAPEANVVGVKVLNKMGMGSLETIIQGVEWCIKYNERQPESNKIDIISMSLGASAQQHDNENDDPLVKVVETAWNKGIVMCVAAGNSGPEAKTIASPGISDQIITVGALDDKNTEDSREDDVVAGFSSRGPTIYGKTKPDILAPGVNIISLRSPNSYLDKIQKNARVGKNYTSLSGTSMATPICAGVVALILEQKPDATPDEVKTLLKQGADLWTDKDPNVYGAGYINAENSVPKTAE